MRSSWDPPWFLWRAAPGVRAVSWRVWVLIWVVPVVFGLGALVSGALVWWDMQRGTFVRGEVVQVYDWPGDTPLDFWTTVYAPIFEYSDDAGTRVRVSGGMRHPSLNFDIGSEHGIYVFPGEDRDGLVPGAHNFVHVWVIAALGAVLALPALWGTLRVRRWLLQ